MTSPLPGVTAEQLTTIRAILQGIPASPPIQFFLFGSRVEGGFRANSDLDILISSSQPLDLSTLSLLREQFEESPLPFKVDLLEECRLSESIRKSLQNLFRFPL